jgi:nucleoid-associated protein YgaU
VSRLKKLTLAAVVLGAGVAGALVFRHTETDRPSGSAAPSWAEDAGHPPATDAAPAAPLRPSLIGRIDIDGGPPGSTTGASKTDPAATDVPPLAERFVDGVAPRRLGQSSPPVSRPEEPSPLSDESLQGQAEVRTHRIVDGDTLSALAGKYLGQADRYLEIFEYNRDVLRDPDLLPIGVELRIPNQPPPRPAASADDLVPLPTLAPTTPVAAATPPRQRVYVVQPGETLADVARNVYGDPRRLGELFEANRDRLGPSGVLKPGMVLRLP